MSTGARARTNPVKPPIVNTKIKPMAKSMGVSNVSEPRHMVATQLNTFTPVGMEMSMVASMKKRCAVTGMPVANRWCAQTRKDRMAQAQTALTNNEAPKERNSDGDARNGAVREQHGGRGTSKDKKEEKY